MLPSRGLRPAHFAPSLSSRSLALRSNSSRKFSSAPRGTAFSFQYRAHGLRSSGWRTGSTNTPISLASIVTVRNGSWYAPWSWGSSKPSEGPSPASPPAPPSDPVVTSRTPELAPETLNTAAVTDTTSASAGSWLKPWSWGSKPAESTPAVESTPTATTPPPTPETVAIAETPEPSSSASSSSPPAEGPSTVEEILDSALDVLKIPENKVGYLDQLGLDYGWGPTSIFQWTLEHIHAYGDMSWGAAIIGTTIIIRILIFAPMMDMSNNSAKMAAVSPLTTPLREKKNQYALAGNVYGKREVDKQINNINKQAGIKPFRALMGPILQGMLGYGGFRLMRGMSAIPVPGLLDGGWAWFTDLTIADPYYILPLTAAGILHLTSRFRPDVGIAASAKPIMNMVMLYVLPGFVFLVSVWMPACLQITFVASNLWGLGQQSLFRSSRFREWAGLAPFPTEESKKFFARVASGDITIKQALELVEKSRFVNANAKISTVGPPQGGMKYQAPTIEAVISGSQFEDKIRLREGASVPAHLRRGGSNTKAEADETEPEPEGFVNKVYWFGRMIKPSLVKKKVKTWWRTTVGVTQQAKMAEERKKAARKKAEEYEWRRQEAMRRDAE